jgi:hypothetical protein
VKDAKEEVQQTGLPLVRVSFSYERRKHPSEQDTSTYTGWMQLDPEMFWCILKAEMEYVVNGKPRSTLKFEHEVSKGTGNLPIIKRSTGENRPRTGELSSIRKGATEFSLHESDGAPESEFFLSSFGLPEPQGITLDARPRYYLWLLGAAVALLSIAFFWRRVARREKPARIA